MQRYYIHRPFSSKKCFTCHIKEQGSRSSRTGANSSRSKGPRITWLQKHYEPATTHFFLVPEKKLNGKLIVQFKDSNGKPKISSIPLPPLAKLPPLEDDGQQPTIENILFHGVKRGILYSATISWETDKAASSQIQYGIGSPKHKSSVDHQFKTSHLITISPVIPGKHYSYFVISEDVYGNKSQSQVLSFSTKKGERKAAIAEPTPAPMETDIPIVLTQQFRTVGTKYFLTITASQVTHMKIGRSGKPSLVLANPGNKGTSKTKTPHIPLRDTRATNITTCLNCHTEYQTENSHPINCGPKPGMIFPTDYPVLKNGKMHCMTCHDTHASNNEARIRRPTKQQLCVGCHKSYA